MAEQKQNLR